MGRKKEEIMATINKNYSKLSANYLFPEIARRAALFVEKNPSVELLRLGIGDTTEPIPEPIIQGLRQGVEALTKIETYNGYNQGEGDIRLRAALASHYLPLGVKLTPDDIFVSDGAKSDAGNIQSIFGAQNVVAVQDPAYPVYVDSNVIAGRTGQFEEGRYQGLVYMPCLAQNNFFPHLPEQKVDLIYLCFPNNPTGAVANKKQLKEFVDYALKHRAVIIFDAAYAAFINDPELPRSIFEIEGAKKCAIEINSFSKTAGFTGVRLGWSVVPVELEVEDGPPGKINQMWRRRQNTLFNGASNIVQQGGLAVLSPQGQKAVTKLVEFYMGNAAIIRQGMIEAGFRVYGGDNAPYVWMETPSQLDSWQFFDKMLEKAGVVGTPGSGFGPSGQGYFRLSAFGNRENIQRAVKRIQDGLRF